MIARAGRAVPLDQPRLPRLRRLPRGVLARQAQEGEAGAAQAGRSRRHVRAQARAATSRDDDWAFFFRCYEHTYRAHHSTPYLSRAFFEQVGRTLGRAPAAGRRHARRAPRLRRARRLRRRHAVGPLLGRARLRARPALRGVLLPGDRVLHRAAASSGSKAARRACTSSRAACGPWRRTRCTWSATARSRRRSPTSARGARRRRALARRAGRVVAVQESVGRHQVIRGTGASGGGASSAGQGFRIPERRPALQGMSTRKTRYANARSRRSMRRHRSRRSV